MKKALLVAGLITAFLLGYGSVGRAYPAAGVFGRAQYNGYFNNHFDSAGTNVFPSNYPNASLGYNEAFPASTTNATAFINFVEAQLAGNNQQKTGAAFIIETMMSVAGTSSNRDPTAWKTDWENMVRTAEAQGHVTWRTNYSFNINSYYQGPSGGSAGLDNNDAFYDNVATWPAMVFRDGNNVVKYALKWQCANPVGNGGLGPLQKPWAAQGRSAVTDLTTGDTSATSIITRPGDTVHFDHWIQNNGPADTGNDSIWYSVLDQFGVVKHGGNSGVYVYPQEKPITMTTEPDIIVPIGTPAGTQYCRQILWDWKDSWGDRNGLGTMACATVQDAYVLDPLPGVLVNGQSVSGNYAEQGDSITFTYSVVNNGNGDSNGTACNIVGVTKPGYYAVPNPVDSVSDVGYVPPGTGCPRNFAHNATTNLVAGGETVVAGAANNSICRTLFVNPVTPGGGSFGREVCAYIVKKPYAKVYGGDVSAGGGVETAPYTCSSNTSAAIIGWNKDSAGAASWAGAGTAYAAYALGVIRDVATAAGNAGAAAPSDLSFANSAGVNGASGLFGGTLGSVPCIQDYYGAMPTATAIGAASIALNAYSGVYSKAGDLTISASTISAPNKLSLYVNGNLYISGNIVNSGSWTASNMPLTRVVVRGNIIINSGVSQLDGLFVAQPNGAAGGAIYTCSTSFAIPTTGGTQITDCSTKLTVNGAFVAKDVNLLRTAGTLSQAASPGEASSSANIAEVFNYVPTVWIPQPAPTAGASLYDAIVSLPPIL